MGTKFDDLKVALVIDDLIHRDFGIEVFEIILGLFPKSTIFTLTHQEGSILGPIEQHRIVSSFLTHKIKDKGDWAKHQYLVPSACKQLVIPCHFDLCIRFSRGFAHRVEICEGIAVLDYFFDTSRLELESLYFRQRIFKSFVESFSKKLKSSSRKIQLFSNPIVKDFYKNADGIIAWPGIDTNEYKELPASFQSDDYVIVDSNLISQRTDSEAFLKENNLDSKTTYWYGEDKGFKENFLGRKCAGELVPILAKTKKVFTSLEPEFSDLYLKAKACNVSTVLRGEFDPIDQLDQSGLKRHFLQSVSKLMNKASSSVQTS
ncbi:MAG: hypothetical protein ACPGJV_00660 [Bacteriovoracaceae bacterium]